MKKRTYIPFLLLCFWGPLSAAAQGHIPVFTSLNGEELEVALQDSFRPASVLDYSQARDTLFKLIDSRNDTVYGIYSHLGIYLPPGEDPTEFLFMNGASNGINTEHSWPRSKGAREGNANSDMHHLFPSRTPVNADRASLPFGESEDSQTQKWYYQTETRNNIPADRDLYSELGNQVFEPREASKGNIARACFYFYTIYRQEALNADPVFFETQRSALCQWHLDDPVDKEEWERSQEIAHYQDGKVNPFISDCTLAHRTYCSDFSECRPVSTSKVSTIQSFQVYPNPAFDRLHFNLVEVDPNGHYLLTIVNMQGQITYKSSISAWDLAKDWRLGLNPGLYIIYLRHQESGSLFMAKFLQN
jgi:endonuclease I